MRLEGDEKQLKVEYDTLKDIDFRKIIMID